MSCPTSCILGENLTFTVQCLDASGSPAAPSAAPTYKVYEDETSTEILSGTMGQLAATTGFYSEQIACTAANGFEQFKSYVIRITATVDSQAIASLFSFLCVGAGDTPSATSGALTSVANVKTYAGITTSDDDALLGDLISRATDAIEAHCGRVLREDTYRERYDGSSELLVNHYPVTAVSLLSVGTQDVLRVTNTSSDAYNASVTVTLDDADVSISETMTLVISGGGNAGTDSLTLSSYTITSLVAAINALSKGWSATVNVSDWGVWDAIELLPEPALNCLNKIAYFKTPYQGEEDYEIVGMTMTPFRDNFGCIRIRNYGHLYSQLPYYSTHEHFHAHRRNVVIKYTAGYATTPADLEQITIDLTLVYYKSRKSDNTVKREKLGQHDITYKDTGTGGGQLPTDIQFRLAKYKRWS